MSNDDHDRLIRVAANWYGLYNELFVKAQRLTDENVRLRAALLDLATVAVEVDPVIAARVSLDTGRVIEECVNPALAAAVEGEPT